MSRRYTQVFLTAEGKRVSFSAAQMKPFTLEELSEADRAEAEEMLRRGDLVEVEPEQD